MRISSWKGAMAVMLLLLLFPVSGVSANNAREARALFNSVWDMYTSPNGVSLGYSVNIIGIYKTAGTIWVKERDNTIRKNVTGVGQIQNTSIRWT